MTDIYNVAQFFLSRAPMSHKKLQKLCYYAQAWYLANHGNALVPNRFEAWIHGPVSPDLYSVYKNWGWLDIPMKPNNDYTFTPYELDILQKVYQVYGNQSGDELESSTHCELPWLNARIGYGPSDYCRIPISMNDMKKYYGERIGK